MTMIDDPDIQQRIIDACLNSDLVFALNTIEYPRKCRGAAQIYRNEQLFFTNKFKKEEPTMRRVIVNTPANSVHISDCPRIGKFYGVERVRVANSRKAIFKTNCGLWAAGTLSQRLGTGTYTHHTWSSIASLVGSDPVFEFDTVRDLIRWIEGA